MDIAEYASRIKIPSAICFSSKRNTGKSVMVNALIKALTEQKKIDSVIVFSATARFNDDYPDLPDRVKQEYSEDKLFKLIEHQKTVEKEKRKRLFVVFDDLLGDKSARRSDLIMYCYAIGRHLNISPCLIVQIANNLLTPTAKANSDYIFLSRLNRGQLTSMWETAITNIDKRDFIEIVEMVNKDYKFLAIDNTSQSNDPEEFLSVVKVDLPTKIPDKK